MCLLRGLNGHIRVTYRTSLYWVGIWSLRPPSSAPGAPWPPLEARYLGYVRIASTDGVYPLTCEEEEEAGVWCVGAMAGYRITPVWGFRTLRVRMWEFLRLWTGFELPSSWVVLPAYGSNLNRNILDFMK
jgi:hypothetical protein